MEKPKTCKRCHSPSIPNRTLCQAHADAQKIYMQNWHRNKANTASKVKKENGSAPLCTSVVQAAPKPRKPAPVVESIEVTPTSIDATIEQLRGDLEVLERAKTVLERHHG